MDNEETKDIVENEVNETKEEVKEEESGLEFLSKGMEELFSNKDEDETPVVEESEDKTESETEEIAEADKTSEVEKELIPQKQVDIARKLGWSDERIIKTAEESPDELVKMVELLKPAATQREIPAVEVVKEEKEKPVKIDHVDFEGLDELEPDAAKVASTLIKGQNNLIDIINKQNEQLNMLGEQTSVIEKRNQAEANAKIDSVFDDAAEHIPELGKVDSLTSDQIKTRQKVYGMAKVIENTDGLSESSALEEAIYLYGLSKVDLEKVEQEAEDRVKEKINTQKKAMSPRPGGKKPLKKVKVGKEAAVDYLTEGMKEIFGN